MKRFAGRRARIIGCLDVIEELRLTVGEITRDVGIARVWNVLAERSARASACSHPPPRRLTSLGVQPICAR